MERKMLGNWKRNNETSIAIVFNSMLLAACPVLQYLRNQTNLNVAFKGLFLYYFLFFNLKENKR